MHVQKLHVVLSYANSQNQSGLISSTHYNKSLSYPINVIGAHLVRSLTPKPVFAWHF